MKFLPGRNSSPVGNHWLGQRCTTCGSTAACGLRWWNLRPSTCNLKYMIWRPYWRILKQNKRKARKSVDSKRNNLDGDATKSYRMNTECMLECVLCWLALVLPTGICIYIYQIWTIWYIFKELSIYIFYLVYMKYFAFIWYIFVGGFSWDFQPIYLVYYKAETDKRIVVLKL